MCGLTQIRDLIIWKLNPKEWLVFATDNLAGIGELTHDRFAASAEDAGYFTARVALFELLTSGAAPTLIIDTVSAGGTYGERIIAGIRAAVREAGLPDEFPVTGSTESNVPIAVTALGVTVVGHVPPPTLRLGSARAGDEVWLVGTPKSAPHDQVLRGDPASVSFSRLHRLLAMSSVREVLPVGSRGAVREAQQLATTTGLRFLPLPTAAEEIATKSGGPATAVLVAGRLSGDPHWRGVSTQIPCLHLGNLLPDRLESQS